MKKILLVFVSFVLGIGATVLVLTNPFEWEWMHGAGHALMGGGEAATEAGEKRLWTCGMHPQVIQDE
ncbi:MAG: hypothetical protein V3S00_01775, partial [Dehalococcoidia bacterium]